jgi:hypothetical protein
MSLNNISIHFFTIVLNGEPFIRYHIEVFRNLPFRWHWHIVEGVAKRVKDSTCPKGKSIDQFHDKGHSKDGTLSYIQNLASEYPGNITLYIKNDDQLFWNGHLEMVSAPLKNIQEECLLWQIDVDEFWTIDQIIRTRNLFITHPEKTAAYYWCLFFVSPQLVITTRNCYAQNPKFEWLRTWRFTPGLRWESHAPPRLVETHSDGRICDLAYINPFLHHETEKENLVFQHFAYFIPKQIEFKASYYGYLNVEKWIELQKQTIFPVLLKDYFNWVDDETMVNTVHACGIKPLISINPSGNIIFDYSFRGSEDYDKHIFENVIDRTLEMHQLDELIRIIESIESSKIWKIRSLLMKLLGRKVLKLSEYLSSIEDESIEKRFTEIHLYLKKIKESNCWKIWQKWVNFKRSIQHF